MKCPICGREVEIREANEFRGKTLYCKHCPFLQVISAPLNPAQRLIEELDIQW